MAGVIKGELHSIGDIWTTFLSATRASQAEESVKAEVIHKAKKNEKYVKAPPRRLSLF